MDGWVEVREWKRSGRRGKPLHCICTRRPCCAESDQHPRTRHKPARVPHAAQVIMRRLALELMTKLDDELRAGVAEHAAFYEHRLQVRWEGACCAGGGAPMCLDGVEPEAQQRQAGAVSRGALQMRP